MEHHEIDRDDNSKRSRGVIPYIIIALLVLIIIILLGVFFLNPESVTKIRRSAGNFLGQQQSAENTESTVNSDQSGSPQSIQLGDTQPSELADGSADTSGSATGDLATKIKDPTSDPGSSQAPDKECNPQADNVESFFNSLDSRDYIRDFQLDAPSNKYFPELIQKLIDNPPVVSGETEDLFTILQNTAHFFRIIGKKNILLLKGILDRERETFEQILTDFYQLTKQPECLQKRFNLTIDQEPLYAYAGFFLNTMGGRLYLFRRDSMSRMVVSYYAILIVEQANREGRNKFGVDIKDAIENLIIEIESSRIQLQMRDAYLETLYDLMVKYQ